MIDPRLQALGLLQENPGACHGDWLETRTGSVESVDPTTGRPIARVRLCGSTEYDQVVEKAARVFQSWRLVPPPKRGDLIRQIGDALRAGKTELGRLVSLEVGKIPSEGEGEVQEMIDICDYAVGLSRQLHGLTIASERPRHRMFEQWHPLGPVGVITAFNFPVAVWAWNAAIAGVCGNTVVWKPSLEAPLCAVAVQNIVNEVMNPRGFDGVFNLCVGGTETGATLAADSRLPLISATGSCAMGRKVGEATAKRFGRSLLELGGNNAAIVTPKADLDLALRAVVFAAAGTAGQRCTTLRRLFLHESIADAFISRLIRAYQSLPIGDPFDPGTLVGPLINRKAVETMETSLALAKEQGGEILVGGRRLDRPGFFVEPTIVRARADMPIVREETFAPILYVMTYTDLNEAIALQNDVEQGLSSSIFTDSLSEAERFLAPDGSDCGIANVNIGTSGAEIGGAFGGEKATGGGRESGSDAWKTYMRRQTCTVNPTPDLPLAQGVAFTPANPAAVLEAEGGAT